MSKKEKKFEIEIKEVKEQEMVVNEVYINGQMIGEVRKSDEKDYMASNQNAEMRVKTIDEGIQWVIAEFNLHVR